MPKDERQPVYIDMTPKAVAIGHPMFLDLNGGNCCLLSKGLYTEATSMPKDQRCQERGPKKVGDGPPKKPACVLLVED